MLIHLTMLQKETAKNAMLRVLLLHVRDPYSVVQKATEKCSHRYPWLVQTLLFISWQNFLHLTKYQGSPKKTFDFAQQFKKKRLGKFYRIYPSKYRILSLTFQTWPSYSASEVPNFRKITVLANASPDIFQNFVTSVAKIMIPTYHIFY